MRRVRAIATGVVQGVSYRATTAAEARRLRVVGWVKNLDDGSVELEAQGEDAQVAALLAWCEHGPPGARVSGVAVEERALVDGEAHFAIRR